MQFYKDLIKKKPACKQVLPTAKEKIVEEGSVLLKNISTQIIEPGKPVIKPAGSSLIKNSIAVYIWVPNNYN